MLTNSRRVYTNRLFIVRRKDKNIRPDSELLGKEIFISGSPVNRNKYKSASQPPPCACAIKARRAY